MSRSTDKTVLTAKSDTLGGRFVETADFYLPETFLVESIQIIGRNPADGDGDTVALDVSTSSDGFAANDVELAADAAAEYNDTDNTQAFVTGVPQPMTLTGVTLIDSDGNIRVPSGNIIRTIITWTGSPADGALSVAVVGWYI